MIIDIQKQKQTTEMTIVRFSDCAGLPGVTTRD